MYFLLQNGFLRKYMILGLFWRKYMILGLNYELLCYYTKNEKNPKIMYFHKKQQHMRKSIVLGLKFKK